MGALRPITREQVRNWYAVDPEAALDAAHEYYKARVAIARRDVNEFIELVIHDEETGAHVKQAPIHERFQQLCSENKRLIVWSHIEAGKTVQVSIGRVLWEIGRNPKLRVAIVAASLSQTTKIVTALQQYIERPGPIHDVFPHLRQGDTWSRLSFSVAREGVAKDPTVQVSSVGSGSITGARIDLVILDDILTQKNTREVGLRQGTIDWFYGTIVSRMTRDCRVWALGNAFHPEDLYHHLSRLPSYRWIRLPVIDAQGRSNWPERWSMDRIEEKRLEVPPHEFARSMLCVARDDAASVFKREWVEQCLRRGDGRALAYMLKSIPAGCRVYTGVDLGTRKHKKSDLTVFFTFIVHPNGDREVLSIESGRWAGPEIVDKVIDVHNRYGGIILVENNSAQQFILDFAKHRSAVPVRPFNTGANKWHPEFGVESIATELANGKWIIPSVNGIPASSELAAWINELLYYDPKAHTGDRLMACWFARDAASQRPRKGRLRRLDTMSR